MKTLYDYKTVSTTKPTRLESPRNHIYKAFGGAPSRDISGHREKNRSIQILAMKPGRNTSQRLTPITRASPMDQTSASRFVKNPMMQH